MRPGAVFGRQWAYSTCKAARAQQRRMLLGIDHSHGPAGRCVLGALSIVVSLLSRSKVLSVADLQRVIGTAQDVRERHSTTMPSSSLADQDGASCPSMRDRPAFGWPLAYSGHSTCQWPAMSEPSVRREASRDSVPLKLERFLKRLPQHQRSRRKPCV